MVVKKKSLSHPALLKKTQSVFNRWIRLRDSDRGCISCGRQVTEAGHYLSQGHHSAFRFSEMNTNGQCTRCNCFLHGNLINYRQGLLKKHGEQRVQLLEGARNKLKKWTRFELELIMETYKII